mmetsp:Transcript_43032/g.48752  ORF Transcript_43032/g.48752 Transcript_43032/m.48752 type:complete len:214 (+) Transcript_43032:880-1521(+)
MLLVGEMIPLADDDDADIHQSDNNVGEEPDWINFGTCMSFVVALLFVFSNCCCCRCCNTLYRFSRSVSVLVARAGVECRNCVQKVAPNDASDDDIIVLPTVYLGTASCSAQSCLKSQPLSLSLSSSSSSSLFVTIQTSLVLLPLFLFSGVNSTAIALSRILNLRQFFGNDVGEESVAFGIEKPPTSFDLSVKQRTTDNNDTINVIVQLGGLLV